MWWYGLVHNFAIVTGLSNDYAGILLSSVFILSGVISTYLVARLENRVGLIGISCSVTTVILATFFGLVAGWIPFVYFMFFIIITCILLAGYIIRVRGGGGD